MSSTEQRGFCGVKGNLMEMNNSNNKHKANLSYLRLILQSADDLWNKRLKEILQAAIIAVWEPALAVHSLSSNKTQA